MNTASRMESNSEKNKITMSSAAVAALHEQAPSVRVIPRGELQIKGKVSRLYRAQRGSHPGLEGRAFAPGLPEASYCFCHRSAVSCRGRGGCTVSFWITARRRWPSWQLLAFSTLTRTGTASRVLGATWATFWV